MLLCSILHSSCNRSTFAASLYGIPMMSGTFRAPLASLRSADDRGRRERLMEAQMTRRVSRRPSLTATAAAVLGAAVACREVVPVPTPQAVLPATPTQPLPLLTPTQPL